MLSGLVSFSEAEEDESATKLSDEFTPPVVGDQSPDVEGDDEAADEPLEAETPDLTEENDEELGAADLFHDDEPARFDGYSDDRDLEI